MSDCSIQETGMRAKPLSPKALIRTSSLVVGARVAGAVIGIATQMLLALFLSAEHLGLFFFSTGCAAILSIICTLGYSTLVPKIAAQSAVQTDQSLLQIFMTRARLDAAVLCSGAVGVLIAGALWLPNVSPNTQVSLLFAAFMLPAFAFMRLNGALANALKRFELGFLPELFVRPFGLLLIVLAMGFVWGGMNIHAVLIANVAIASVIALWQSKKVSTGDSVFGSGTSWRLPDYRDLTADWRSRALPLVLAALFIGVFADLAIVVSRVFLSGAETGIFGVCLKISLLVAFAIQAVHQIILRDTADALRGSNVSQLRTIISRANLVTMGGSVVAFWLMYVFGSDLLGLFGEEFRAGYECLILLMLAQVLRAGAGPATQVLTLSGHEKACLPVFAVSILTLLLGNAILVPLLGLTGAALSVVAVFALWPFWVASIAHRKIGLRTALI